MLCILISMVWVMSMISVISMMCVVCIERGHPYG